MTSWEVARGSAWVAVAIFTLAMVLDLRGAAEGRARLAYVAAAAALGLHVLWSMLAVHHGSLQAAVEHTARQTRAQVGVDVGVGVYANFALLGLWIADATGWLISPAWAQSRRRFRWGIRLVLLFFFFNAAIVFAHGVGRGVGFVAFAVILGAGLSALRPNSKGSRRDRD